MGRFPPVQKIVDAKLEKRIKVGGYRVSLFARGYNLFDIINERYVFDDTGSAKYTYESRSNQESEQLIANYGMPGIHTWEDYTTRPNYYSPPRSFKIGLSLDI